MECKAVSTPKEIAAAAETAKRSSRPPRSFPMVVVPYLPEPQLRLLQERQVSGIDLSGNALITVPGEILVSRTGAPNNFRRAGVIKNVYRKNSSIVPRVFLLKPQYDSITAVMDEIKCRGGSITQATVSKVCNSLDQDLVIERTKGQLPRTRSLRLIQPDKLLELLAENYAPPANQPTPHRQDHASRPTNSAAGSWSAGAEADLKVATHRFLVGRPTMR